MHRFSLSLLAPFAFALALSAPCTALGQQMGWIIYNPGVGENIVTGSPIACNGTGPANAANVTIKLVRNGSPPTTYDSATISTDANGNWAHTFTGTYPVDGYTVQLWYQGTAVAGVSINITRD